MKRYYSHYTFIYPDISLKNHIVEIDDEDRITGFFPFTKEIEKTEFYSGLLIFLPKEMTSIQNDLLKKIKDSFLHKEDGVTIHLNLDIHYRIFREESI
ncbi:hypothetical protein [Prevotella sp. 10(H)]|uniref:hypothetical protein n=1 Tax=Prevotella sp. 10(H) TaxID=1158294 RepID=UPI0004A74C00|nr:hypothetical protein [Prevotella sp. 10(H)]